MSSWQPSSKCQLTLKQLGFSSAEIHSALICYRRVSTAPDDEGFRKAIALAPELSIEQQRTLQTAAQIPLAWRPSAATQRTLMQLGFDREVLSHYCAMFVIHTRESDTIVRNPDVAFQAYCRCRPRSLPTLLPVDWLPAVATIEAVAQRTGLDWHSITDQLGRFINKHQQSMASDWDDRFLAWMTESTGTAVFQGQNGTHSGVTTG